MRNRKLKLFTLAVTTVLLSCNRVNFSKPEEVVKGFKQYASKDENGKLYDEYLSSKSKEFVTKDEFIKDRMYEDSILKNLKSIDERITEFPVDVSYPSYRRFKIDETILVKKDTTKSRNYFTLINENGKWKIIWTETLLEFADQKSDNGDYSGARKTAEKIIEINPFDGTAYNELATCYYRDDALPNYERNNEIVKNIKYALTLEEDNYNHYNILASYYSNIHEFELAIQSRLNALKYCLNEDDKLLFYENIGSEYLDMNKFEGAETYEKKALATDSSSTYAWFTLGVIMDSQDRFDDAMKYYEHALLLPKLDNSLQCELFAKYSLCCLKKEKCDKAKEYINKALIIDPSNESYQLFYSVIQNCNNK